jgi:hypothetical protein
VRRHGTSGIRSHEDFRDHRRQIPHRISAISDSGLISISFGPGMGLGQGFTQATATDQDAEITQ